MDWLQRKLSPESPFFSLENRWFRVLIKKKKQSIDRLDIELRI